AEVLVRVLALVLGPRPGERTVALDVGDIDLLAVRRQAHAAGIPAGGNQAEQLAVGGSVVVLAFAGGRAEPDDRDAVVAAVGHVQRIAAGRQRERVAAAAEG